MKRKYLAILCATMLSMSTMYYAGASSYTANTRGVLGPSTVTYSIGLEGSANIKIVKFGNSSPHRRETLRTNDINVVAGGSAITGASVSGNDVFSKNYSYAIGTNNLQSASAHFYTISNNFGNCNKILSY